MCCGDKKLKKKTASKKSLSAVRDNGKVLMRYLGKDSVADWRVPGFNRTYRVSVAKPLFFVIPDHADPLTKFVYKGRQLFEIVPPDESEADIPLDPATPPPVVETLVEPVEEPVPPEVVEADVALPVEPEEELPFTDPAEPDATGEVDEDAGDDDEDYELPADTLWGTDDPPKKTRKRTSK